MVCGGLGKAETMLTGSIRNGRYHVPQLRYTEYSGGFDDYPHSGNHNVSAPLLQRENRLHTSEARAAMGLDDLTFVISSVGSQDCFDR